MPTRITLTIAVFTCVALLLTAGWVYAETPAGSGGCPGMKSAGCGNTDPRADAPAVKCASCKCDPCTCVKCACGKSDPCTCAAKR